MLDYHAVKNWRFPVLERSYEHDFAMLYGLAVGLGADPLDEQQLRFVAPEEGRAPAVLPTMATVLGYPGFWIADPKTGIDATRAVHGEEHIRLHRPLPAAGTLVATHRVTAVVDKGAGRGALVEYVKEMRDKGDGALIASATHITFCRNDGGFSEGAPLPDTLTTMAAATIVGPAPATMIIPTSPQQALLYRLCGDRNPLHARPDAARAAGFARPILHGLCTFGIAAHAVVAQVCHYRPERLRAFGARFSAPVYPGETLRTDMTQMGSRVAFRTVIVERDVVALDRGYAELALD